MDQAAALALIVADLLDRLGESGITYTAEEWRDLASQHRGSSLKVETDRTTLNVRVHINRYDQILEGVVVRL